MYQCLTGFVGFIRRPVLIGLCQKKEGLGKMTKFASYVAIVISTGMIICCIICMLMCCGGHKGGKCGGGKCGPGEMSVHKKMMMKHHGGMNHHGNCCKGDDKACDHHHGEKDAKAEADTIK
jgi:hypothetical protein